MNLLSFKTEYSMEKTKESQDAPQREDDIHGVLGNGAAWLSKPGWGRCWTTKMRWKFLGGYMGLIEDGCPCEGLATGATVVEQKQ